MTDKSIFVKSLVLVVCAAIVILLPSAASIKTVNLNGKIKYDQSTVASDAAVSLLNETDLSLIYFSYYDREGNFRFAKLKPGKYFVAAGAFWHNKLEVSVPMKYRKGPQYNKKNWLLSVHLELQGRSSNKEGPRTGYKPLDQNIINHAKSVKSCYHLLAGYSQKLKSLNEHRELN